MNRRIRSVGYAAAVALLSLTSAPDLLACGDKFLVTGRGTRYHRPKNARAASVLIYADPATGLPASLEKLPVESVLKREGHRSTTVTTREQLAAILAGGRFDVVLAAGSVVKAIEQLLGTGADAPVVVAMCVDAGGAKPKGPAEGESCSVKAPPKERSLLEAIDKAVMQHDKNARKGTARG